MEGLTSKKAKKTINEGESQGEHQVSELPPVVESISNKKRVVLLKWMPSLEKPSPIATAHLKIETIATIVTPLTPSTYKMHIKLKKKDLQCLSPPHHVVTFTYFYFS